MTVPAGVKARIDAWLRAAGIDNGRIFRPVGKGGAVTGTEIRDEKAVWRLVVRYAEATELGKLAPHDLRRTCAKLCRKAGGELEQVMTIASKLEDKSAIPMVAAQLALLQAIQTDEFWTDVQVMQLEEVRRKLRALVKLIERAKRKVVYTSFEDELGDEAHVPLPDVPVGVDIARLRAKALDFLKKHERDAVVQKLKWNEPLVGDDLAALEKIFLAEGTSTAGIEEAKRAGNGLGLFVRSLVGLDRAAARRAFASFLTDKTLAANQIKFVELVIDHLSRSGWLEKKSLYESPFVDLHPSGIDGLFADAEVGQMLGILTAVWRNAQAYSPGFDSRGF